ACSGAEFFCCWGEEDRGVEARPRINQAMVASGGSVHALMARALTARAMMALAAPTSSLCSGPVVAAIFRKVPRYAIHSRIRKRTSSGAPPIEDSSRYDWWGCG